MESKRNCISFDVDFKNLKYDKKNAEIIIRKISKLRKKADFFKKSLKINIKDRDSIELHKIDNMYEFYICVAIKAVQIDNKKERCNFLYDEICYFLDHVCRINNLCDFKNDKCFVKQNTDVTMGCCHHFPDKKLGIFYQKKMIPCEYLGEKGCITKAIGCKLYMCPEVNKKGYKFTVNNVLLVKYFFNIIQKIIIVNGIFDTKENIMKRLLMFNY